MNCGALAMLYPLSVRVRINSFEQTRNCDDSKKRRDVAQYCENSQARECTGKEYKAFEIAKGVSSVHQCDTPSSSSSSSRVGRMERSK